MQHAYALETLKGHMVAGARVLDVGSGSGYLTACMALMVGEGGIVVGIEHINDLVEKSITNIRKSPNLSKLLGNSLRLLPGDGRKGHPDLAPYDAIHVGAAAESIPQAVSYVSFLSELLDFPAFLFSASHE